MKQKPLDIDWLEVTKIGMPIVAPLVQGIIWYGFLNIDKRAQALGRLIAIAEIIPAVDLNLPKGVVLASMYDSTEDSLKMITTLLETVKDIPNQVKEEVEEIVEEIKDGIVDPIIDPVKEASHEFQTALANCVMNAKDNLKYGTYYVLGPAWIVSCMYQKGYTVTLEYIKGKLF